MHDDNRTAHNVIFFLIFAYYWICVYSFLPTK